MHRAHDLAPLPSLVSLLSLLSFLLVLSAAGLGTGCGDDSVATDSGSGVDSGSGADSGGGDSGTDDSGASDSGADDSAARDSGSDDSGPPDGAATDSGATDGSSADTGTPDTGVVDAGPVPCTDDDGCASGFWCRPVDPADTSRECVPYADDGEFCGGFVPLSYLERCHPGAACLDLDPRVADLPGRCGVAATVAELEATPATYDGRFVSVVTGWLLGGPARCTELACGSTMPCCNSCSADEYLADAMTATAGLTLRDASTGPYTCTGDNCNPYATCTRPPNLRYRVSGTYDASGPALDVTTIVALP